MAVSIGFIGAGDILDTHLDALRANPEFELAAICRRSKDKLEARAAELECRGFTDYADLLAEGPDVVLVSLPHGLHCEVTLAALEAGCHVLVEKPMAVSAAECRNMLRAARERDRRLLVTESASFFPGALLTGQKFRDGALGRFFTGSIVNARAYFHAGRPAWFLDPAMSGGGMFSNVGLHRLAVARACLPGLEPVAVSASVSHVPDFEVEACTSAHVRYAGGGAMLYEEVGYYTRPDWLNVGTHFVFEEGFVSWTESEWRLMTRSGEAITEPLEPPASPYAPIYANMLKAMRGEPYGPQAWELAVDTAIAQAAYAGAREGREIDLTTPDWAIAPV